MPTKQRDDDLPLSPAMIFTLMTGESAAVRIHGWVALAQQGQFGEPTSDEAWNAHRETLIREAAAHNFEPYWSRSRPPSGAGFRQWRERFLAEHTY